MIEQRLADLEKQINVLKRNENKRVVNYSLMLQRAKVLMWVYLILILALKLCGFEVIEEISYTNELVKHINDSPLLRVVIKSVFSNTISNIIFSSIIKNYLNIIFKINLLLIPYSLITSILIESNLTNIFTIIFSTTMYFIPLIFKIKVNDCIKIMIIDFSFQIISLITRDLNSLEYSKDIFITLILAFDYYVLWLIYSISQKVGEKRCQFLVLVFSYLKKVKLKMKFKNLFPLLRKQQANSKENSLTSVLKIAKMNLQCYVKFILIRKIKRLIPLIVFFTVYILSALFMDKIFESILLLISYGSFKFLYPKQFHADYIPNIKANMITFTCVCLSCLVLCTALYNTLSTEISILSSIVVALVLDWILYIVREVFDYWKELPFIDKLKTLFTPKEELISKLKDNGFKDIHIKIAVLYLIDKKTMQQVSEEVGYSLQHCKNKWGEITKVFPELKKNSKKGIDK